MTLAKPLPTPDSNRLPVNVPWPVWVVLGLGFFTLVAWVLFFYRGRGDDK